MGFIHVPVSVKAPGGSGDRYDALFLIDTGGIDSMAPSSALRAVGIHPVGRKTYELADGSREEYAFGLAQIEFRTFSGRDGARSGRRHHRSGHADAQEASSRSAVGLSAEASAKAD